MTADYLIERARADDVPRLPEIERKASELFQQSPLTADLPLYLTPAADFLAAQRAGLLWVARAADSGELVGFALAEDLAGELHLEEVDVLPEHGRRGVGTRLVREVIRCATAGDRESITLCTFADVPWNAPFYERLGFRRLTGMDLSRALRERMVQESRRGLPSNLRVAMRFQVRAPILWRRLDREGHESCRLLRLHPDWHLMGAALFTDDRRAVRLEYTVVCDAAWETTAGRVTGWVGDEVVEVEIAVDKARRWSMNGAEWPSVRGCVDLDLNFSPSTNLLPIRRLALGVGQEASVKSAWLRFPSFELEPLEQTYTRLDVDRYRYQSAGGAFEREIEVDATGLVTRYPGFWEAEESLRNVRPR